MKLQFHTGAIISFIVLTLIMSEAHELSHYVVASISCGCHGTRADAMQWFLCKGCNSETAFILATFAGPFVTYIFMWTGFILMGRNSTLKNKCLGFVLITGTLPFPKLIALLNHGGDEIAAMRIIHQKHERFNGEAIIIGAIIILVLTLPPLWRAFRSIQNQYRRWIFLAILLLSSQVTGIIFEVIMNDWLAGHGVLMKPVFWGIPLLIILWDIFLIIAFLLTRKNIKYLIEQPAL